MFSRLFREASRRRVFRTAALYVVWAWLALQVADVLFPAFDLSEAAKRPLLWAVVAGFPLALVFGWMFDIGADGIRRTAPATARELSTPPRLRMADYWVLAAFAAVLLAIGWNASREVMQAPRAAPAAAVPATDPQPAAVPRLERSIAVLPFTNISSDPDNEYFCDGISEEILNRLGAVSGLTVIARTSSFAFKGSDLAIPRLGELLGVRYLLQGSVRKAGTELRIAVQLLDEAGVQVWQQSFDRRLENVFAIQSEIAEAVAGTVAPQIATPAAPARDPDLVAYDHYLRGRELLHRRSRDAAVGELQQAVAIDPQFAEAHAELAASLLIGYADRGGPDLQLARGALDRAQALNPGLLRAQAVEGLYLQTITPADHPASERVLRAALERDPNMSDALNWLAAAIGAQAREEESFEVLQRAVRIDPLHPAIADNLARGYANRGETTRAEQVLERATGGSNPPYTTIMALRDLYEANGKLVAFNQLARRQLRDGEILQYYTQALSFALLGDHERAAHWLRISAQDYPDFVATPFFGTMLLAWQGRYAEANVELRRTLRQRSMEFSMLPTFLQLSFGQYPALAGECTEAIGMLEPVVDTSLETQPQPEQLLDPYVPGPWHALARCYRQRGDEATARGMLEDYERVQAGEEAKHVHLDGITRFHGARNALLLGNTGLALERLEQAVGAGWRSYHVAIEDPCWNPLRGDARFVQLMDRVRADIALQRAAVERLEASEAMDTIRRERRERDRAQAAAAAR